MINFSPIDDFIGEIATVGPSTIEAYCGEPAPLPVAAIVTAEAASLALGR